MQSEGKLEELSVTFVYSSSMSCFEGVYPNGARFQFQSSECPRSFRDHLAYLKSSKLGLLMTKLETADMTRNEKAQARLEAARAVEDSPELVRVITRGRKASPPEVKVEIDLSDLEF